MLTPLTPTVGVSYKVDINDAHGRFIAKRSVDATHTEYWITDGDLFNSTPITLLSQDFPADPRTNQPPDRHYRRRRISRSRVYYRWNN